MKLPTIVYKTPGSYAYAGGTFDYKGVNTEAELEHFIKDGWFLSLAEAIDGVHDLDKPENQELEVPDEPPAIPHVADPLVAQQQDVVLPAPASSNEEPLDKSGGTPADQPGGLEGMNQDDSTDDASDTSVVDGMTRAELKAKAKELEIEFDGRSSNAEIARLITERQQGA